MKLTERYSCGHQRTEKGKHACPACLAARRAVAAERYRGKARAKYQARPRKPKEPASTRRPQAIISAERRAATIARIEAAIDGANNWQEIAARLGGVTRQRVFQVLRWLDEQKHPGEAQQIRRKREFYRAEKRNHAPGTRFCFASNSVSGHVCVRPQGHSGEHCNDYRGQIETWV